MHNAIAKIHRLLKEERDRNPQASFQRVWDNCRQQNPQLFGELEAADWQEDHKAEEREKAPETSQRWHNPDNQTDMGDYHSAQSGQSIAQTQPYGPGKHYPNLKDRAHRGRSSEAAVGTYDKVVATQNPDGSLIIQGALATEL
jgi:hypothetical protein